MSEENQAREVGEEARGEGMADAGEGRQEEDESTKEGGDKMAVRETEDPSAKVSRLVICQ